MHLDFLEAQKSKCLSSWWKGNIQCQTHSQVSQCDKEMVLFYHISTIKHLMYCNIRKRMCKGKIISVTLLVVLFSTLLGLV